MALAAVARAQAPPPAEAAAPAVRLNTTGASLELPLPVREQGRVLGEARVRIDPEDRVAVHLGDLSGLLARLLAPATLDEVRALGPPDDYASPEAFGPLGIAFAFDPAAVEAEVVIPPELMGARLIELQEVAAPALGPAEAPAAFSLLANYRVSLDWVQRDLQAEREGVRAPVANLDFAGRIGFAAYQSEFSYDDERAEPFVRLGTRLIVDQESARRRWTAGDLLPEAVSFQALPELAGLSVSRSTDLFDNTNVVRRQGQRSFTLARPSIVDVRVNGQTVRRLSLRPGRYDLQSFPFVAGVNEVEIEIEDDTGAIEVLRFDFFADRDLLPRGERDYAVSAGVESEAVDEGREYGEDAVVSGYLRAGIADFLTVGANLQAKPDAAQIGAEATFPALAGLMTVDLAASEIGPFERDYAARLDYRWFPGAEATANRSFNLTVEALGRRFGGLTTTTPDNPSLFTAAARYSQELRRGWIASLSGQWSEPRAGRSRSASLAAGLATRIRGVNLRLGAVYEERGGREELTGSISLTRRLGRRQDVSAGYDGRGDRWQAAYGYAQEGGIGAWGAGADLLRADERISASARARYAASRADLSVDQITTFEEPSRSLSSARLALRAAGAAGYAGGRAAIGRPAPDAFAILSTHETLEGRRLRVGAGAFGGGDLAASGPLGPALVGVRSYARNNVPYTVTDLPEGYDLGASSFLFRPRLHDGYARTVGSQYNVTVIGRLLDFGGNPLALRTAEVVSLDEPSRPPIEIFTNRDGRFGAAGLAPGRWRIRVLTGERLVYAIEVADDGELLVRAGDLAPEERPILSPNAADQGAGGPR